MKKIIFISLILSFSLTLSGCWDSTETEKLGVVTAMGISLDKSNNFEIAVQEESGSRSNGQNSNMTPFNTYCESAPTISEALQKITSSQSHKVYLAHTKVIILSEELVSSKGLLPVIDFCERDPQVRFITKVLISKKGQFEKIFSTDMGVNTDTGTILDETIRNEKYNSLINANNLESFLELMNTSGNDTFTAGVNTSVKHSLLNPSNITGSNMVLNVKDIAVFKGDKMAGWLTGEESRGLSWVYEDVKGGMMTIKLDKENVSLRILKASSSITPVIKNGKAEINISIKTVSNIFESQPDVDYMNPDIIKKVTILQGEKIEDEISEALNKSKVYDSDILGLGNQINMKYPLYWKNIEKDWYSSYYPSLKVNIYVSSQIQNIGKNYKPFNR